MQCLNSCFFTDLPNILNIFQNGNYFKAYPTTIMTSGVIYTLSQINTRSAIRPSIFLNTNLASLSKWLNSIVCYSGMHHLKCQKVL